jgi:hypothetical protein
MQIRYVGAPSVPPGHCQDLRKAKLPYRQLNNPSCHIGNLRAHILTPCVLYVGTYGAYSLASKAVGMTPHEHIGKPQRRNGVLTGKRGDPTFEYREAAKQVRGTIKGPHKQECWGWGQRAETALRTNYYFIYACYQAAGLARHLAGDTEAEQKQSDAVIEKLHGPWTEGEQQGSGGPQVKGGPPRR